jgi:uncharacterized protein YecT (DUF1311 family)
MIRFNVLPVAIAFCLTQAVTQPIAAETIAASTQPGVAPPACESEAQTTLNRCSGQWARTADFLRSLIYEDLYWQLKEPLQSQLAAIEATWTTFRDTYCQETSARFREGSIYPLILQSCRAKLTNDRIADLQALSEPGLETEDAEIRLRELVAALELTDRLSQRQWRRYQTTHCAFEAQRFPEHPPEQCRDRLNARRIRQLEDFNQMR